MEGIIFKFITNRGVELTDEVMLRFRRPYTREEAGDEYEDLN
jgi:hypothetical protein